MRVAFVVVATLALVGLTISPSSASDARTLGGYRFVPTPQVRDPFITTHVRNMTAVAFDFSVELPPVILPTQPPDTLGSPAGDFVFVIVEFEYQYAFGERATLRGEFFGASRIGTSAQSVVAQGVTALSDVAIGTTVALWRTDRFQLSALADVGFGKVLLLDLVGYVEDIVGGNGNAPSLLQTENRTTVLPGVCAAWAVNGWSGLAGSGQVGSTNGSKTNTNTVWKIGASASVDFGQRNQAPVGLLASVEINSSSILDGGGTEVSTSVGFGVSYTGREDLNVGVDARWSKIPLEYGDATANPITVSALLRYYF